MYGYLDITFLASFIDRVADIIFLIIFFNNLDVEGSRIFVFEKNITRSEKAAK